MDLGALLDTLILMMLGLVGWGLFAKLRLPIAPLLGTITVLTLLRGTGIELPLSPPLLFPFLQILLGIYVGSKVNREALRDIKPLLNAALIIVVWALSIVFVLGPLLAWATPLDLYTALLSFSVGGLPEMTMIALATGAEVGFIVIMQLMRFIATVALFPLIFRRWLSKESPDQGTHPEKKKTENRLSLTNHAAGSRPNAAIPAEYTPPPISSSFQQPSLSPPPPVKPKASRFSRLNPFLFISEGLKTLLLNLTGYWQEGRPRLKEGLLTLLVAGAGGLALYQLGVPAGGMVGATLAIAIASLSGLTPMKIPATAFNLMLVALGVTVADNIVPERFAILADPQILALVLGATALIFVTSLLVTYLIKRISGWDLPTSFLAAAPGGFSVMVALAIKYDKDPFPISMLHLCRLLSIKMVVPFVFMYLM